MVHGCDLALPVAHRNKHNGRHGDNSPVPQWLAAGRRRGAPFVRWEADGAISSSWQCWFGQGLGELFMGKDPARWQGCFILFILDFKWFEHFGYVLIKLQAIFMHEWCRRNPPRPRTTRSSRMWLHWVVVWCFSVPGKCGMLCGSPASSAGHWHCGLWLSSPLVREKKRWRIGDRCWAEKRQFVVSGSQAMPLLWSRSLALYPHPDMCLLNIYTVSRYLIVYLSISIYIYITFFSLIVVSSFGLPQKRKKSISIYTWF